jgi:hypothetical protein
MGEEEGGGDKGGGRGRGKALCYCAAAARQETTMDTISTAFALVALVSSCIATACCIGAFRARNECDEIETNLRRSLGRIAAVEAELDVLGKQLHKLRGKFYANRNEEQEKAAIEIARPFVGGLTCENWIAAQRDGPRSAAATCVCDYCNAKRAERDAFRARVVPKTAQERKDHVEKGKH